MTVQLLASLLLLRIVIFHIGSGILGQTWSNTTQVNYSRLGGNNTSGIFTGQSVVILGDGVSTKIWTHGSEYTTEVNYARLDGDSDDGRTVGLFSLILQTNISWKGINSGSDKTQ